MRNLELDYAACPNNIFGLDEPEWWSCGLLSYGSVSGRMSRWLKLSLTKYPEKGDHVFSFQSVQYFEGPTQWQGANFCVAPFQACIDLMHETGLLAEVPDDQLEGWLEFVMPWTHLYTVETNAGFTVRLIADAVFHEPDDGF